MELVMFLILMLVLDAAALRWGADSRRHEERGSRSI